MSDEFSRGYNDAQTNAAIAGLAQRMHQNRIDNSWKSEARWQENRADAAEEKLARAIDYATNLANQLRAMSEEVSELNTALSNHEGLLDSMRQRIQSQVKEMAEQASLITSYQEAGERFYELHRVAEEKHFALVKSAEETIACLTAARDRDRQRFDALWEEGYGFLQALRTGSAMTAGFEAIYALVVKEIIEKHDPSTFSSLEPATRLAVMDEAWKAFIHTGEKEYYPDLTFSYAQSATIDSALSAAEHIDSDPVANAGNDCAQSNI